MRILRGQYVYNILWRWHFYAGLLIAPLLVAVSITGSMYVFRDDIETLLHSDLHVVDDSSGEVTTTPSEALLLVEAEHPELTIVDFRVSADPDRAWKIVAESDKGRVLPVYIDQYEGKVRGEQTGPARRVFNLILDTHTTLLARGIGAILVELATSWGLISVLTGLYLWWPKAKEKVRGVFKVRTNRSSKVLWRDLHAVSAAYFSGFALLAMFTGVVFSGGVSPPIDFSRGAGDVHAEAVTEATGVEQSDENYEWSRQRPFEKGDTIGVDAAVDIFTQQTGVSHYDILFLPEGEVEIFQISTDSRDSPTTFDRVTIDQQTGDVLARTQWSDLPLNVKIREFVYPVHTGSFFLFTKFLALLTCFVIAFASFSGVKMWWTRRPKGPIFIDRPWLGKANLPTAIVLLGVGASFVLLRDLALLLLVMGLGSLGELSGARPRPDEAKLPLVIILVAIFLCYLFPTVGVTVIAMTLGSLITKGVKRLKSKVTPTPA